MSELASCDVDGCTTRAIARLYTVDGGGKRCRECLKYDMDQ